MATLWPTTPLAVAPPVPRLPEGIFELRDYSRAQRILAHHPDESITQALSFSDSAFWELGDEEGLYYLTDILVGVRASANVVVFPRSRRFKGSHGITALQQMCPYVMRIYNLARVQAAVCTDNILSNRLASAVGMTFEGTMRDYGYVRGVLKDFNLYSITRKETPSWQ